MNLLLAWKLSPVSRNDPRRSCMSSGVAVRLSCSAEWRRGGRLSPNWVLGPLSWQYRYCSIKCSWWPWKWSDNLEPANMTRGTHRHQFALKLSVCLFFFFSVSLPSHFSYHSYWLPFYSAFVFLFNLIVTFLCLVFSLVSCNLPSSQFNSFSPVSVCLSRFLNFHFSFFELLAPELFFF